MVIVVAIIVAVVLAAAAAGSVGISISICTIAAGYFWPGGDRAMLPPVCAILGGNIAKQAVALNTKLFRVDVKVKESTIGAFVGVLNVRVDGCGRDNLDLFFFVVFVAVRCICIYIFSENCKRY